MSSSHKKTLSALKWSNLQCLDTMASLFGWNTRCPHLRIHVTYNICIICMCIYFFFPFAAISSWKHHSPLRASFAKMGFHAQILNQHFPGMVYKQNLIQTKKLPPYPSYLKKKKHVEDWVEIHIPNRDLMVFNSLVPSGNLALHFVGSFYSDVWGNLSKMWPSVFNLNPRWGAMKCSWIEI